MSKVIIDKKARDSYQPISKPTLQSILEDSSLGLEQKIIEVRKLNPNKYTYNKLSEIFEVGVDMLSNLFKSEKQKAEKKVKRVLAFVPDKKRDKDFCPIQGFQGWAA